MTSKFERLTRLIREGFEVTDITSDDALIEARLMGRRGEVAVIRFNRDDAERILYEDAVVVARAPSRASRYRIVGPLR